MENNNSERSYIRGVCRYCGQALIVSLSESQEEADEKAAEECDCDGAVKALRIRERIQNATDGIEKIFGSGAADADYEPLGAAALEYLKATATLMVEEIIEGVSVKIPGVCVAKLAMTGKGTIKICRSEGGTRTIES